jgi:uncharacterized membrane protein YhaH (DUF805 family)
MLQRRSAIAGKRREIERLCPNYTTQGCKSPRVRQDGDAISFFESFPMRWIIAPFRHYATFTGRALRIEFWPFFAFFAAAQVFAHYLDGINGPRVAVAAGMGIIELVVSLLLLLPFVAVGVRRLHDTNRSGGWMLLLYIPYLSGVAAMGNDQLALICAGGLVVGTFALLVLLVLPGDPTANRYGEMPSAI